MTIHMTVDANVSISISEIIDELPACTDKERDQLRQALGLPAPAIDQVHPWTFEGAIDELRQAFFARNTTRFEDALRALRRLS